MNRITTMLIAVSTAALASAAQAHGDVKCKDSPQSEWKPQTELQKKLVSEGWKVRQVKTWNNCYEVYGFDAAGERVEAFYDPKSFERVDAHGAEAKK